MSFAALLTCVFLSAVFIFSWRALSEAKQVSDYHIPILQLNAISVRLTESLSFELLLAAETQSPEWLEQFLITRDALVQNLEDLQQLSRRYNEFYRDLSPLYDENWERTDLSEAEDKIIEQIRLGQQAQALDLIDSPEFQSLQSNFRNQIQVFAESVATERDQLLSAGTYRLKENIILSVVLLILTVAIWLIGLKKVRQEDMAKKMAQEELERQRAKSFHSAKLASLGEMAGGIAHEINNPLAIISGYARRLQSLVNNPVESKDKIVRYSEKIEKTSYRMAKIVNSLRRLSRNSINEHFEDCSIKSIVEDVLEISIQRFKNNLVTLEYPQPVPDIHLRCRSVQISQVILNLLNNAYDACLSSENRIVKIEIKDLCDGIQLRVMDSGPGIPAEVEDRIFEPFYTTKALGQGTGLGLSISKSIIDEHKGRLQVYRESDFTVFEIQLWKDPDGHLDQSNDLLQMQKGS